jgi:hypothetical protein
MSKKYITEVKNNNFVYPNNTQYEYGEELVQALNNNQNTGNVSSVTAVASGNNLIVDYSVTYNLNGAEQYKLSGGTTSLLSVHMMAPNDIAFKPWRMIAFHSASNPSQTGTITGEVTVTPADMGLSYLGNGNYFFEFRFISHLSVYPETLIVAVNSLPPTPTPTPTPSPTPTATPTVTPTPPPTVYYTGTTLNVTDTGYIKYYTKNLPTTYVYKYISSTGTVTLTDCLNCSSITYGFPFADLAAFTVTNCGSAC